MDDLGKQVAADRKKKNITQKEGGEEEQPWFEKDFYRKKKVSKSLSPKNRVIRKVKN